MQKNKSYLLEISNHGVNDYLPAFSFLIIAVFLVTVNSFPAFYGDEPGSLFEANHLTGYIHPIGYYFQLYIWNSIIQSDWFLRLLSVIWFGIGLYSLNQWLKSEAISNQIRTLTVWLALLNPFLWFYGFQIRFYAMFFAASILFVWRFRVWQKHSSGKYLFYLLVSAFVLLTSNLFGVLVVATAILNYLWTKLGSRRWVLAIFLVFVALVVLLPITRSALLWIVYRASKGDGDAPSAAIVRGISLAILAKVPFTFYFFTLGLRVYPLWWWLTIPAMIAMGTAFGLGLWQLRRLPDLSSLTVFMLLNVPFMFLVLDPLAPPSVQGAGAAPRYLIFVIPYFLLLLALGAQSWSLLKPVLIITSLVGLYFVAVPSWSYGGNDFMNWPHYLKEAVLQPRQTCVITDGRAQDSVIRYAPSGTKTVLMGKAADCLGFSRIILVSNDYRLFQVRYLDQMGESISLDYALVSNTTLFPAQITVYEKKPASSFEVVPSRLDLPEQDLRFPIFIPERGWQLNGFARLDNKTPSVTIPLNRENVGSLWALTNYRAETYPEAGTPVFKIHFNGISGRADVDVTLHAGEETSDWEGHCDSCVSVYEWTKLIHLLGGYAYPGAYHQYQAHVWGFPLRFASQQYESVTITYLLPNGMGYFWGVYPENH